MDASKLLLNVHCKNNECNDTSEITPSSSKAMDSPKTPVRPMLDDSLEGYETEEMESPKFPHLIPVYRRTTSEYDLDIRIGWDDGFGSLCFQDDDYGPERRRFKKRKKHKLFSEPSPVLASQKCNNSQNVNSSSPRNSSSKSNAIIQTELNDYLECILSCLQAKKKNRQLMKSINDANSTTTSSIDNNNDINSLLNDSSNEMMVLCSQAIEKQIAEENLIAMNTTKDDPLSIAGISPLKNIDNSVTNNLCHNTIKKFKPIEDKKKNENVQFQSHINDSSESQNNKDELASEDYLFSSIDLAAIERQISTDIDKTSSVSTTQKYDKQFETKTVFPRTSISNVNKKLNFQQDDKVLSSDANRIDNSKTIKTRYCTASEIAAKKYRAQRTLMLKFKSKNKSV